MSVDVYSGAQVADPSSSPTSSTAPSEVPASGAHPIVASETERSPAPELDVEANLAPPPPPPLPGHHERRERLAPALALIEEHLAEDLPVARAARTVAMSPSHFRRFFKQVVGQSYVRYVHRRRVERACELIANTELSLYQIAIEVGFCDQSYFGLVFRRLLHTTPAAYRRKFRADAAPPPESTPPATADGPQDDTAAA